MAVISEADAGRALAEYELALAGAPLAEQSRRAYRSRVSGYLSWLAGDLVGGSDLGGDPLTDRVARDCAVREYRSWVGSERGARPSTVNAILTALDHFYGQLRMGATGTAREPAPASAGRVLDEQQQRRFLQAVEGCAAARDRAIALALFHTGVRVAELVALDLRDLRLAARMPSVIVRGSGGGRQRVIPVEAGSRPVLRTWIRERGGWPGASTGSALFLNRRGGRLTTRSIDELVVRIGREARISGDPFEGQVTPQILRNTFASRLLHDGTDVVLVARLLGHRRLDTTRRYGGTADALF